MRKLLKSTLLILIVFAQFFVTSCSDNDEEELKYAPELSTSEITAITSNTITISSSIVDDGNDEVFERGVCWSKTSMVPTILDNNTTDGNGVGDYTSTINNLNPESHYYVRTYATNKIGTSYISEYAIKTLPEDLDTQTDAINIISITPIEELIDGERYTFDITVLYQLNSHELGTLMIGFNNSDDINKFSMISDSKKNIDNGNGQYTFRVSVTAKDWDTEGDFKAYVNLSEDPRPSTWTPLANDTFILIPKK